jgi:hypothetical protein
MPWWRTQDGAEEFLQDHMPTTSYTDTCSEMRTIGRHTQPSSPSVDTWTSLTLLMSFMSLISVISVVSLAPLTSFTSLTSLDSIQHDSIYSA